MTELKWETDPEAQAVRELIAATTAGDWDRAFALADAGIARGLSHPTLYKLRALGRERQGRLDEAIADFRAALARAPDDHAGLNAMGLCLARAGRTPEAIEALDRAIALQPGFAAAHYNKGWALESQGDLAGARGAYAQALNLEPDHVRALGSLASIAARTGAWAEARDRAGKALALEPGDPSASIALATAELGEGRAADAETRLHALLQGPGLPPHERAVALGLKGDVLDALARPAEAFAAYAEANATLKSLYAGQFAPGRAERASAYVARLAAAFEPETPDRWRRGPGSAAASGPARGHVFLLGFPRSGTTLLGQVLGAHPDIVTLDEQETLVDGALRFMGGTMDLAGLAAVSPETLERLREQYWGRVAGFGADPAGRIFVDKLPIDTLKLPLIARLFPDAKVLFARRDPRDVVLSCLRRRFVVNPATFEFLDLEDAAGFYGAVMGLYRRFEATLELDLRVHRHEDLVGDFDAEALAVLDFIGAPWDEAVRGFSARLRDVATPSAVQIAQGLSGEGVGHWRAYREQLGPVLPALAPWVQAFGYEAD